MLNWFEVHNWIMHFLIEFVLTSFCRTLNITMSSSAITVVPFLDGANYQTWSSSMLAYLCFQKLAGIVGSCQIRPTPILRAPTSAKIATGTYTAGNEVDISPDELKKQINDWDDLNDSTLGAICLHLPDHIHQTAMKNTAKETWQHLEKTYGTPGAAGMYGIFREAIMFEMSEHADPAMPITTLNLVFARLNSAGLILSDSVKAMILLNALPQSWDGLAMSILSQHTGTSLTVEKITPTIIDEFNR